MRAGPSKKMKVVQSVSWVYVLEDKKLFWGRSDERGDENSVAE